jgi:hypothetical protein
MAKVPVSSKSTHCREEVEGKPSDERKPAATKCKTRSLRREIKQTLTLKTGFGYHIMNDTYIDMRTLGSNIYMYRTVKIYKELPGGIQ